jgi:hypothetical protein
MALATPITMEFDHGSLNDTLVSIYHQIKQKSGKFSLLQTGHQAVTGKTFLIVMCIRLSVEGFKVHYSKSLHAASNRYLFASNPGRIIRGKKYSSLWRDC